MLDRVHGEARPGPRIGVAVVQFVRHAIQWRPMQQAVRKIKAHLVDKGHEEEERDESDRVFGEADNRRDMVGVGPEQQHFIGGPYRHAAHQRVKHIVVCLVLEQEGRDDSFGHCRLYLKAVPCFRQT